MEAVATAAKDQQFGRKLGLTPSDATAEDDRALTEAFLQLLADSGTDFTNAFHGLGADALPDSLRDAPDFAAWDRAWRARLARQDAPPAEIAQGANPAVIPRTHRLEEAIEAAVEGDYRPVHRLARVLSTPFTLAPEDADMAAPPAPHEVVTATFCGT